jgi:uncharacterized protein YndB with AHSA1/START domain
MPLTLTRTSPTTLVLTRHFAAPPQAVWDAHMKPDLIRQWLCGEGGTTMPVCENDPTVGGRIHYEWREPDGSGFSLTGIYEVIEAPHRSVHVEVMHLPDPTPENRIETRFDPEGTGTRLTMTMTLPDAASMDGMIASGMSEGLEGCYRQLDVQTA